ncbi:MAG: 3-deoxy-7-phosphoheptulonate synthase class II [Planctomycetes bacterium]|nr:3-deoxy-7-phosphoheptulonate synthase class II [Planctomycetota bacterium]
MTDRPWEPGGWSQRPVVQQPQYLDAAALEAALSTLRACPPLVAVGEVDNLRARLARAGRGEAFILQGGNCAERFIDCRADSIANKLKILLQMSVILAYGVRKPVVRIGRFAGQYAKPRSNDTEVVDGHELPVYRGDAVNSVEPTPEARAADPQRLVSSYFYAAATLNHIRALIDGGFADLRHPYTWNLSSMEHSRNWDEYRTVLDRILDAINFMESFGGARSDVLGRVDFFTSHEGLLLGYEEALTRKDPDSGRWYNLGAHMLWIGMRTRQVDGAHVEYFRGIANPIGLKVDAGTRPEEVLALSDVLNPANEEGRLTLITRLGAGRVEERLPQLIQAVRDAGPKVVWSCDPMHGNTVALEGGRKTRDFSVVLDELRTTFDVHRRQGTHLAGVHFELTADDVTECIGGAGELTSGDLSRRYETYCDPRLNCSQSLEMAFLIARLLQSQQS